RRRLVRVSGGHDARHHRRADARAFSPDDRLAAAHLPRRHPQHAGHDPPHRHRRAAGPGPAPDRRLAHGSPVLTLTLLFAIVPAARFLLSEWVAIPLLTATLTPIAPTLGLHPWVVAFVVLSAANLWSVPYQFASYLAFWSASGRHLFAPA